MGSSGSGVVKLASVVILYMLVVAAPFLEAAVTCGTVVSKLTPCLSYLRVGGSVPPDCCSGVNELNNEAKSTSDRQAACNCLKTDAAGMSGINPSLASGLPGKCGVDLPYKISPSIDCSTVH